MNEHRMEKIVSLAKRRGFIFQGSEIYGGLAGTWDYGPLGIELKNNIKKEWWRMFVHRRDDMYGVDTAILMNRRVWEASGHLGAGFADPLIECKNCHTRFRADKYPGIIFNEKSSTSREWYISGNIMCENCGAEGVDSFTRPRMFNLMFKTYAGPVEDDAAEIFLRPETAQGMFVNFKNILDSMHPKLPFGMAQIGKAFRNEITPGNFIFRAREFEQMEIEYFVTRDKWESMFNYWTGEIHKWLHMLGIEKHAHEREVPAEDRAHYSAKTIDFDFDFPFAREELYGIACRTDFDLKNHAKVSSAELAYFDESSKEKIMPYVIEPTFGVDRTILALFAAHYHEEEDKKGGRRTILKLPPRLAPHKAAVFPLVANKENLTAKAREIYSALKKNFPVAWDDRGNIGKRYYAQDEIGTPWCITVDYQTLEDDTVTVRDRDTAEQMRISSEELQAYFSGKLI